MAERMRHQSPEDTSRSPPNGMADTTEPEVVSNNGTPSVDTGRENSNTPGINGSIPTSLDRISRITIYGGQGGNGGEGGSIGGAGGTGEGNQLQFYSAGGDIIINVYYEGYRDLDFKIRHARSASVAWHGIASLLMRLPRLLLLPTFSPPPRRAMAALAALLARLPDTVLEQFRDASFTANFRMRNAQLFSGTSWVDLDDLLAWLRQRGDMDLLDLDSILPFDPRSMDGVDMSIQNAAFDGYPAVGFDDTRSATPSSGYSYPYDDYQSLNYSVPASEFDYLDASGTNTPKRKASAARELDGIRMAPPEVEARVPSYALQQENDEGDSHNELMGPANTADDDAMVSPPDDADLGGPFVDPISLSAPSPAPPCSDSPAPSSTRRSTRKRGASKTHDDAPATKSKKMQATIAPEASTSVKKHGKRKAKPWSVRHTDDKIYTSFEFLARFPEEYRDLYGDTPPA
ncbi:hypothetical protein C8R44DRAFT_896501 [Mycena epipterygia]|nr:hypothetical protein C8R44DRAFT_896501 [Mycena epipterygia]